MKSLIAEDDFISRQHLYHLLAKYGEVKMAQNGREAVWAFFEAVTDGNPFDLVCLDIQMPEMDGLEALKAMRVLESACIKEGHPPAKIMMTTVQADRSQVAQALEKGCTSYMLKPIEDCNLEEKLYAFGLSSIPA